MSRRLAAVVAVSVLALAGCGKDELDGTVAAKDVRAGFTYVYMQPIYTSSCSGKPMVCSQRQTGMVPIIYHVPTCYRVAVEGRTPGDSCVTEERWTDIAIGDRYVGPDVDPKDRQVKAS